MGMRRAVVWSVMSLIALSPRPEAAAWDGTTEIVDGVRHVANPEAPPQDLELRVPRELWRVGGEDDRGGELLGFVTDVQVDDEGTCYLLDSTLNRICAYSAEGEFLRVIGREGEGPGEFRNVGEFMLMPDGNFGVLQFMPAKVVTLDRQGVPGGDFSLCDGARGLSLIERARSVGDHVVIGTACGNFEAGGVDYALAFVAPDGERLHVIRQETEINPHGNINVGGQHDKDFVRHWDLAPDGRVFVSPVEDRYLIDVYDERGGLVQRITRKYETLRRSDEDLAADRKRQEDMDRRFGGMVQLLSNEYERDIAVLHGRPDGELWVASSRGLRECPDGTIGLFDVFDTEGRNVRRVGLAVDYDPRKDDYLLVGDRLFVLKQARVRPASTSSSMSGGVTSLVIMGGGGDDEEDEGDETPPSVVCYALD